MRNGLGVLATVAVAWLAPGDAACAREELTPASGRMAQFKSDTPIRVVPATPAQPATPSQPAATVRSASVGGLGFVIPAVRTNDANLLGIVDFVAYRLNLNCLRKESFEWPGVHLKSEEGLKLHVAIDRTLLIQGYDYTERELPKAEEGLEIEAKNVDPKEIASIDDKLTIYYSENSDRRAKDPKLLIVWYRETDDLHLILCSAENVPEKKED